VPFYRITADFVHDGNPYSATYFDPSFRADDDDSRKDDRIFEEARAQAIVDAVRGRAGVAEETRKPSRETPPPLFDLTSLQREGNRRFGWSARRVLGAAQRCYEAHKLLTYPRTDSRCLPNDYRQTVDELLQSFAGMGEPCADYAAGAQRLIDNGLQNDARVFNDAGVSDHFAIIPTGNPPPDSLSGDDRRLYDLVTRRFLATFHPPARWERVERITRVEDHAFRTRARALKEPGWRACLAQSDEDEPATVLPPLREGDDAATGVGVEGAEVELHAEETRPPARLSEARLLGLMENAGRTVEDEEIAEVMRGTGLGTPATRAEVIENLITKGYAVRQGKSLRPSVKGIRLIDTLERIQIDRLASARLTGEIESHLRDVEKGELGASEFMQEMSDYACAIVDRAKTFEYEELYGSEEPIGICPHGGQPVVEGAWFYSCEKDPSLGREDKANPDCPLDSCPMLLWKDSFGRYLDRGSAAALLRDGKTPVLDGFTARNGRTYKGVLEFDFDEGRLMVTSEGWNEDSVSEVAEYEVNAEPLGQCPLGKNCNVFETPTHFICDERKREDDEKAAYKEARKLARERGEKAPPKPDKPDHPGFILPRTVCKREITRDEAMVYLKTGKTDLLEDFTSRLGRPFSATLVQKDTGRHGFEFPPRKARGAAVEGGAADKDAGSSTTRKKTTRKKTTTPKKTTRKKTTRKKAAAKTAGRKKTTRKKATTKKATKRASSPEPDGD
jgi:DNA topoisomerase-3